MCCVVSCQSGKGRSTFERSTAASFTLGLEQIGLFMSAQLPARSLIAYNILVTSLTSAQLQVQISALLLKKRLLELSVCKHVTFFWFTNFLYNLRLKLFLVIQLLFGLVSNT
jgi:hypothetical protein